MECYIPVFFSCVCVSFRKGFISWNMLLFCDRHFYSLSCLLPAFLVLYWFSTPYLEWLQHFHSCSYPWSWQAAGIVVLLLSHFFWIPDFSPLLPLHYRVAKHMYLSIWCTHCQRLCFSQADHFPRWGLTHHLWPVLSVLVWAWFVLRCLSSWFLWKGTLLEFGCFSMTNHLEVVVFSVLLKSWPRIILFAFFVFYIFVCF